MLPLPVSGGKGGINPARLVPREIMDRRMASDMSMMYASHGPKKHTVTAEEKQLALQDLQSISHGWYSAMDRIFKSWPIRLKLSAKRRLPVR